MNIENYIKPVLIELLGQDEASAILNKVFSDNKESSTESKNDNRELYNKASQIIKKATEAKSTGNLNEAILLINKALNIYPYTDWYFKLADYLAQDKKYDEAFAMLTVTELIINKRYTKRFYSMIMINKRKALIYKKMKDKRSENYHKALCYIGQIINCFYLSDPFYEEKDNWNLYIEEFNDNELIKALGYYFNWLKPRMIRMKTIVKKLKEIEDNNYSNNYYIDPMEFKCSLYQGSTDMEQLISEIDNHPFSNYYAAS